MGTLPAGSAGTVATRLDGFLRADGYPKNIQIVTVSSQLSLMYNGQTIFLPYNMPSTDYAVLVTSVIQTQLDDGVGWEAQGQDHAYIALKGVNSFVIHSR